MRYRLMTATSAVVFGLMTAGHAAGIDQDGANAIRDNLNSLLPEDIAKSGVVAVNPAGARYEITYDLAKLLSKFNPADLAINGLKPISMFATPRDDGLWNVEGDSSLNVSGHFKAPDKKRTDFTYSIASMVHTWVFDPAISYFRSGDFSAKDIKVTTATDTEQVDASFGDMKYKLTSADGASADRIDFAANGTLTAFAEQVHGKDMPPIRITADTIDFEAKVASLPAKQLRDIVIFAVDHADEKQMSKESEERLKGMLRAAFPLVSSFEEVITLNNLAVTSAAGGGGAQSFAYRLAVNGPSNATQFDVAMNAANITFDSPMIPAAYSAFVPQAVDVQLAIPGMDFAAFGDEFMKLDLTKPPEGREDAGKKAVERLFRNGRFVIDIPKVSAKSGVYDIDISARVESRIDVGKQDYALQASVLARDYDKTIAAVQELAKTNPELNQASFGMLMVKGFAKTDPDGRQRWDVTVTPDGTVSVNGQQIKGPDKPE
ncbi:hypothetical protein AM571_CH02717 [Rhizobium etli 8C-3]|uniref:DUF2125 domain-containing protein n=1 Tax=Rhizobium etli 8C-3 TaxID=538025 RepID=A0A1L5P5W5_RHIET|nr:hypothetical protein [Rhizobium etli]APO75522.1 hypothetical protein AM571_CH02717 [Rhizobium etli 8C-3]